MRPYNRRSELAVAQIGTNRYGYAYDMIGNRIRASANFLFDADSEFVADMV